MDNNAHYDRSITTLTMAVERLIENQNVTSSEVRELTKTITKLDVVMEKLINIESKHTSNYTNVDERLRVLEKGQLDGCPALEKIKIGYEGRYDKIVDTLDVNKKNIESVQAVVSRVAWGIATAVGLALLGLVVR